jgi:hypothetical protein
LISDEEEMGPEQLAAYRAELAQFVKDNEETIRREQDSRREKVVYQFFSIFQQLKRVVLQYCVYLAKRPVLKYCRLLYYIIIIRFRLRLRLQFSFIVAGLFLRARFTNKCNRKYKFVS